MPDPDTKHNYPENYPPGSHWAVTRAWAILDTLSPGILDPDVRDVLCDLITAALIQTKHDAKMEALYESI